MTPQQLFRRLGSLWLRDGPGRAKLQTRTRKTSRRWLLEQLEDRTVFSTTVPILDATPALFAQNQGQWDSAAVRYAFTGSGVNVLLTDAGPIFQVSKAPTSTNANPPTEQFAVHFNGANQVMPVGVDQADTVFNYYVGDPSQWHPSVATYTQVAYDNLYSGIDLRTWGRHDSLKYEFHVAPGADYRQIQIQYDGIDGLALDGQGMLHVQTAAGEFTDAAPEIYQEINGQRVNVAGSFQLLDTTSYTFTISGAYDPGVALVIDPLLNWSTYMGGTGAEWAAGLAVDSAGYALVTGTTESTNFVGASNAYRGGGYDVFVAKVNNGGGLTWVTYLGGTGEDFGTGIAVDAGKNALVTGSTNSRNFSGANNAYPGAFKEDSFVAKVNTNGVLVWATYLGGNPDDEARGIAVDSNGNSLVTGFSASMNFGGANNQNHGGKDAFVAKVSSGGTLAWATYLGGGIDEYGNAIAVDGGGNALVTGSTNSADFNGANRSTFGGPEDAFVAKVNTNGTLAWATYVGGTGDDAGFGVAVDGGGNALITGSSNSVDFTRQNDSFRGGTKDAFVAKVSGNGSQVWWSTHLGGNGTDAGSAIAVDGGGNVVVTGSTNSGNFVGATNTYYGNPEDAFVSRVTTDGALSWSTYFGGNGDDSGAGVALDSVGYAFIAGGTTSTNLVGANNAFHGGGLLGGDAFVTRYQVSTQPPAFTSAPNTTFVIGNSGNFTITTTGIPTPGITRSSQSLPGGVTFHDNGNGTATLSGIPAAGTVGVYTFTLTARNGVTPDATQAFTLTVKAATQAPLITSGPTTTFVIGSAGNFIITTTGVPTPTITRSSQNLPSGVTFHDNGNGTATLAGTPAAGTAGTYSFTLTAHNGVNPDATQAFTLKVTGQTLTGAAFLNLGGAVWEHIGVDANSGWYQIWTSGVTQISASQFQPDTVYCNFSGNVWEHVGRDSNTGWYQIWSGGVTAIEAGVSGGKAAVYCNFDGQVWEHQGTDSNSGWSLVWSSGVTQMSGSQAQNDTVFCNFGGQVFEHQGTDSNSGWSLVWNGGVTQISASYVQANTVYCNFDGTVWEHQGTDTNSGWSQIWAGSVTDISAGSHGGGVPVVYCNFSGQVWEHVGTDSNSGWYQIWSGGVTDISASQIEVDTVYCNFSGAIWKHQGTDSNTGWFQIWGSGVTEVSVSLSTA